MAFSIKNQHVLASMAFMDNIVLASMVASEAQVSMAPMAFVESQASMVPGQQQRRQ
jgi:hypothetical protein